MYRIGGENGNVERDYEYLIYYYTNENILDKETYNEWRAQFKPLDAVPGIGTTLRLFRDPDQRDGQYPGYKYLLISGFSGDPAQMEAAVAALKLRPGNTVIFFKAIAPFHEKQRQADYDEQHIFMALTNAREGKEDEFNDWYNNHHVIDIVRIRCYQSCRRYLKTACAGDAYDFDYLALYRFGGRPEDMRKILKDYALSCNIYMRKLYKPEDAAWVYSEITNESEVKELMEVKQEVKTVDFYEALKNRRSIYATSAASPIPDEKIIQIIKDIADVAPSSFNSQSSKVVVLFGKENEDFWKITLEVLRKVAPKEGFKATEDKIDMFANSHGTILYYEDMHTVENLQLSFPLYKDNFPIWAEHSSAMLQLAIWTALSAEGLGATLQHYNPIIDEEVARRFDIPSNWKLIAQMPFGGIGRKPEEAHHLPIEEKVFILNS